MTPGYRLSAVVSMRKKENSEGKRNRLLHSQPPRLPLSMIFHNFFVGFLLLLRKLNKSVGFGNPMSPLWPNGLIYKVVEQFKGLVTHWEPVTDYSVHAITSWALITPLRHECWWVCSCLLCASFVDLEQAFSRLSWTDFSTRFTHKCIGRGMPSSH